MLVLKYVLEVDLEKGLPEAILISLDNWQHVQQLDYEQLPFKFKSYHEYGHFAKDYKKEPQPPQHGTREREIMADEMKNGFAQKYSSISIRGTKNNQRKRNNSR
jgi:hypothetical protein